jgi:hypothetical protein
MRATLILTGAALILTAWCLAARRRSRSRTRHESSRRATERWEDEGGALRGHPG